MSGTMPSSSQANIGPVRPKPVMTSSATKRMPRSRQASRIAGNQPFGGTMMPPEPVIGSQKKAATRSAPISSTTAWNSASEAVTIAAGSVPTGLR